MTIRDFHALSLKRAILDGICPYPIQVPDLLTQKDNAYRFEDPQYLHPGRRFSFFGRTLTPGEPNFFI